VPVTLIPDPTRAILRILIELPRAMKSKMLVFDPKREKFLKLRDDPNDA
jgi:hypothetical protein